MTRRLLNVGCGNVFHPAWENLDSSPASSQVRRHDVREGLPYEDGSCDAVYASHVLEHLPPDQAARLVGECFRVLKPEGLARFAVPDLEAIARLYLQSLEGAAQGDAGAAMRYDWALLELYDQVVRTQSGGAMAAFLHRPLAGEERRFIAARVGEDVLPDADPAPGAVAPRARRLLGRLRTLAAHACALAFLGREGSAALGEGMFRRSGEVHQWMYDRFSMQRLLSGAGFSDVQVRAADESGIAGFASFGLETRDGRPRKPDSLYVEARKPAAG